MLCAAGTDADPAVVGKVLDFLRRRVGAAPPSTGDVVTAGHRVRGGRPVRARRVGLAGPRQPAHLPDLDPAPGRQVRGPFTGSISGGDLTDLIAEHVLARRGDDERRRSGRSAEENAVGAFRHLWSYLVDKGYATDNIAGRLRKPARTEPRRRGFLPDEAALLRQLARSGTDPLLDEITLTLPERLGLRRIELGRVRINDISFTKRTIEVWGKGDKCRIMPIPPALFELVEQYLASRRPTHLSSVAWHQTSEVLLRRPPTNGFPLGRPTGRRRIEDLFTRLQTQRPRRLRRRRPVTALVPAFARHLHRQPPRPRGDPRRTRAHVETHPDRPLRARHHRPGR